MDTPRVRESWQVTLEEASGSYTELSPLLRALGFDADGCTVAKLRINRVPVKLSLDINSGTVTGLSVEAKFEAAPDVGTSPSISFRKEDAGDLADKGSGLTREVQVGDRLFDSEVFLDSDATDDEVRRVLAREETRDAVRGLLRMRCTGLKLFPHRLTVSIPNGPPNFETESLLRLLEWVVTIARTGGPRGAVVPRTGGWLPWALFWASAGAGVLFIAVNDKLEAGFIYPVSLGFSFATLCTVLARPWIRRTVAGDSGSGTRSRFSLFWAFTLSFFLGAMGALAVNAMGTKGPPFIDEGTVKWVGEWDSEDHDYPTTIEWPAMGRSDLHHLKDQHGVGERVRRIRYPGAVRTWGEHLEFP